MLTGSVFITGGAGFLGRAILRRAAIEKWPAKFTIYSRDEEKQFRVKQHWPDVRCILGDVRNLDRLIVAMQGHETVIHASAVKFVPEAEYNVAETIEVNVQGSINVAMAARAAGVRTVVGVSTDKACLPVNLYGATKMVMERLFGEANGWGDTNYVVTRYGNVVGSTGSIVPVFRKQLEQHGEVRVTDPTMTRFWLAPDDAVDLIGESVRWAELLAGKILVPLPGAMQIGELARLIAGEAPVKTIGARPGEKKHEALVSPYEATRAQECRFYDTKMYAGGRIDSPWQREGSSLGLERLAICPTTTPMEVLEGQHLTAYTSDHPRFWFQRAGMARIIDDAETI